MRLRAFDLAEEGWRQKDIAEALGVTEGAVSQWPGESPRRGQRSASDALAVQQVARPSYPTRSARRNFRPCSGKEPKPSAFPSAFMETCGHARAAF
ncbi:MAG: hypothetical protein BRD47_04940 [Bacteroidetes bacterium QS_8_68_28]|nr:MAG: hypothetical protein BRD47_04940 [Bacteroidetes bacterium QS_8_68_28]